MQINSAENWDYIIQNPDIYVLLLYEPKNNSPPIGLGFFLNLMVLLLL